MLKLAAVALLALAFAAGASAQTCMSSSITEDICRQSCALATGTVSVSNGCVCTIFGIDSTICTGAFATAAEAPTCSSAGVTEEYCRLACSVGTVSVSNGCACTVASITTTVCTGAFASSGSLPTSATGTTAESLPSYSEALQEALDAVPSQCADAVRSFYNRNVYNCLVNLDESDATALFALVLGFSQYELGSESFALTSAVTTSLCGNTCLTELVGGFGSFANNAPAGCLDSVPEEFSADALAEIMPTLQLYCTAGGNGMCGDIADAVNDVIVSGNGTLTMDTCNMFNMYGKCLGTFRAFGNAEEAGLGDGIAMLIENTCMEEYSVDVTSASTGTEAPAALGSSASAVFASMTVAALAVVLALLF